MDVDKLLRISAVADQRCANRRSRGLRNAHDQDVAEVCRRKRRPYQLLQEVASTAQRAFHNREHASQADFQMKPAFENKPTKTSKGTGSGRWKQRTAAETIRIAFSDPATHKYTLAKSLKPPASSRYCTDVQYALSNLVLEKQFEAIETMRRDRMDFLVMTLTFDESKIALNEPGVKGHIASDMCVLACHGRLLWGVDRCAGFEVREEEVVCKPVAMETNSAAAMWASFMQILPPALISLLQGDSPCRSVAFCPTCDSASANAMLITHVHNKLDD